VPNAAVIVPDTTNGIVIANLTLRSVDRYLVTIDNTSAVTVFLGDDNTVTAATGISLYTTDKIEWELSTDRPTFTFQVFGIVASGTATVRWWYHKL
jgi:hypothetical protein